jgi:hypothetical protein
VHAARLRATSAPLATPAVGINPHSPDPEASDAVVEPEGRASVDELRNVAAELGIAGRSKMKKDELVRAIQQKRT